MFPLDFSRATEISLTKCHTSFKASLTAASQLLHLLQKKENKTAGARRVRCTFDGSEK